MNPITYRKPSYDSSFDTLMSRKIETKIADTLPENVALGFYEWTLSSTPYSNFLAPSPSEEGHRLCPFGFFAHSR